MYPRLMPSQYSATQTHCRPSSDACQLLWNIIRGLKKRHRRYRDSNCGGGDYAKLRNVFVSGTPTFPEPGHPMVETPRTPDFSLVCVLQMLDMCKGYLRGCHFPHTYRKSH